MEDKFFRNLGLFLLRVGLGLVFTIFGFDKLVHPFNWVGWIPNVVRQQVEASHVLTLFGFLKIQGMVEGLLGLFVLFGFRIRLSALLCAAILVGIVYFLQWDQIGIRDTGLLFSSLALFFLGGGDWSMDRWCRGEMGRRKK